MASNQDPPSILRFNTPPVSIPTPDDHYCHNGCCLAPARSNSPVALGVRSTTSTVLLRTPPAESQIPSRRRTRTSTTGDNSPQSPQSSSGVTRSISPSGNRSKALSPGISSGGGSFYSSDTGRIPLSVSSMDYLTPPQFQADYDKRPYRARRSNSDSLSMMRNPKRVNNMPHDKIRRRHRHDRRQHKYHGRSHEHRNPYYWCPPVCQVAPTAPKGMKELCIGRIGKYKPLVSFRGNMDTYGRILPRLWTDPAPPVISRRWTSVEVGSRQIHLPSALPPESVVSSPGGRQQNTDDADRSHRLRPHESLTFTRGAIDHDIVRIVREILTLCKVPSSHLHTPATITLRRTSDASGTSGANMVKDLMTSTNGPLTGSTISRPYSASHTEEEKDTAYLITSKEIDSITELIEATLNRINTHSPATPLAHRISSSNSTSTSTSTSTLESMLPTVASPSVSVIIASQPKATPISLQDSSSYLRFTTPSWTPSRLDLKLQSQNPQNSAHEVVWEAESPNSPSSMEAGGEIKSSSTSNSSTPSSLPPQARPSKAPQFPASRLGEGDAFDPKIARQSTSEWSWRLPQAEIST